MKPKTLIILASIIIIVGLSAYMAINTMNKSNVENKASSDYETVTGTAEETTDGYYVAGHLLNHNEIKKYNASYTEGEYRGKKITITAKIQKETFDNEDPYAETRTGTFTRLTEIQSIEIN